MERERWRGRGGVERERLRGRGTRGQVEQKGADFMVSHKHFKMY